MLRADIEQMIARNGTNDQTRNERSNGENEHSKTSLSEIEGLGMERAIPLEQPKYTTKRTKKQ